MSTTSSGLSRTRSIRQPMGNKRNEPVQRGVDSKPNNPAPAPAPAPARNEVTRNTSPSRLPVKPLKRSATSSAATASSSSTTVSSRTRAASSTTGTSRPLPGVYSGRSATGGRRASPTTTTTTTTTTSGENGGSAAASSTAAAKPPRRAVSMRQAPSSITTSSTSAGRIRTSDGPASPTAATVKQRQVSHTRAKSAVTNLTAATTLRPVSTQSTSTTSSTNTNRSAGTSSPTSATIPNKPQTRSQTLHTRAKSQSQSQSQATSTSTTTSASASASHNQPQNQSSSASSSNNKPAFTTHQQHYSPAKSLAPKPLTSAFLAPPSPSKLPANVALSAETARLQAELLQLALARRAAPTAAAAWRASARRKLAARFARLAAADAALAREERRRAEGRDAAALARWGNVGVGKGAGAGAGGSGSGSGSGDDRLLLLDEKIQLLDEIVAGVWALGDPASGRFARAARAFEGWVGEAAGVLEAQRRGGDFGALAGASGGGGIDGGGVVLFLSDLDDGGWKGERAGLARRLDGYERSLRELGDAGPEDVEPDGDGGGGGSGSGSGSGSSTHSHSHSHSHSQRSGLARVLEGCRSLVHGMLAELEVMEQIGRDAAAAEDEWIERMSRELKVDDTPGQQDVPLWKMAV